MPFPISLEQHEYESLVALARRGTLGTDGMPSVDKAQELESFLKKIERQNGIERHFIWVQWQEQDAPLPGGMNFPEKWPPELRASIGLISRPIALDDVNKLLAAKARKPTNVLVTRDPAARVGWTTLDAFFK